MTAPETKPVPVCLWCGETKSAFLVRPDGVTWQCKSAELHGCRDRLHAQLTAARERVVKAESESAFWEGKAAERANGLTAALAHAAVAEDQELEALALADELAAALRTNADWQPSGCMPCWCVSEDPKLHRNPDDAQHAAWCQQGRSALRRWEEAK